MEVDTEANEPCEEYVTVSHSSFLVDVYGVGLKNDLNLNI